HPDRYIIHRNDGLIHVIRSRLNAAGKRPVSPAARPICGPYAWSTVIVEAVCAARICR
ncbi:MAG: hypothetical protein JWN00_1309, partial [Actinomycetia bacterium]|nr:hypothetical protein [Actinomycetes bacterium]